MGKLCFNLTHKLFLSINWKFFILIYNSHETNKEKLKLYNRTPPNGLAIYCGDILTEDGKQKKLYFPGEFVLDRFKDYDQWERALALIKRQNLKFNKLDKRLFIANEALKKDPLDLREILISPSKEELKPKPKKVKNLKI